MNRPLWVRTTVLGLVVAAVTAIVAGLVSAKLVAGQSREVLAEQLAAQADVVAAQLGDLPVAGRRVTEILDGLGVEVAAADEELVFKLVQLTNAATGRPLTDDELRVLASWPHELALLYPGQLS